jgi:hypothetical protein
MLQVAWLAQWLAPLGVSVAVATRAAVKRLKNFRKMPQSRGYGRIIRQC